MLVTMSQKELDRIPVLQQLCDKRLTQSRAANDAASQLLLSERQIQRLMDRYRSSGPSGLASLKRGKPSNHCFSGSFRAQILALLRENYSDFGPTLAAEKLRERHQISVSVETLRHWMTADGLWVPHSRRKPRGSYGATTTMRIGMSLGLVVFRWRRYVNSFVTWHPLPCRFHVAISFYPSWLAGIFCLTKTAINSRFFHQLVGTSSVICL